MHNEDTIEASSRGCVAKKRKISCDLECAAYGCGNTYYDSKGIRTTVHFFKFPAKNPDKNQWCNLIKRQEGRDGFKVNKNTYLCHLHFKEGDYKRNPTRWKLHKGIQPSLNLYKSFESKNPSRPPPRDRNLSSSLSSKLQTSSNLSLTTTTTTTEDSILMSPPMSPNFPVPIFESSLLGESHNVLSVETGTQTEYSFVHHAFYMEPDQNEVNICLDHAYSCVTLTKNVLVNTCVLQEEMSKKIKLLSDEIFALKEQINAINLEFEEFKSRHFSLDSIKNDPSAVKFYTGFPNYESLISVFKYFEPKFQRVHYWTGPKTFETIKEQLQYQSADMFRSKPGRKRTLSLLEEFFIVLLRLKVGLFVGDIADRYHISSGHVSKIFTTWINFLYHELPLLFPFPSQAMVRKYMPNQ